MTELIEQTLSENELEEKQEEYIQTPDNYAINWILKANLDIWKNSIKSDWDVLIIIDGKERCITGDTIINCNRANLGRKFTIKNMYEHYRGIAKGRGWDLKIPTFVRSFDGNKIRLHKIQNVLFSGKQDVFKLTLNDGKTIKATLTHKFLTNQGWATLDTIRKTPEKYEVMTDTLNSKAKALIRHRFHDIQIGKLKYHPYSKEGKKRIAVHILIYESYINKIEFNSYLEALMNFKEKSEKFKFVDSTKNDIHHIDNNHYNNSKDNLICTTKEEHHRLHSQFMYQNFNQGTPIFSGVKEIKHMGIENTYDIVCEDPHHNFVANGMVVHNSGKSAMAFQLAKYCDPTFNIERIAFTPNEFIKLLKDTPQYGSIVYDESRRGLSSRSSMSRTNKDITSMLAEVGQKNLFIFIVLPSIHDLDRNVGGWRARLLIHVEAKLVKDENDNYLLERGYARIWGEDKLMSLTEAKNRRGYSYDSPNSDFAVRFEKHYVVDEKEYRKRKKESLEKYGKETLKKREVLEAKKMVYLDLAPKIEAKGIVFYKKEWAQTLEVDINTIMAWSEEQNDV